MQVTWLLGLVGGLLIGGVAVLMWFLYGRIMGVSGIVAGLWQQQGFERQWRWWFFAGMLGAGLSARMVGTVPFPADLTWPWLILAGFLVGFGTRMGSGCTSGHGVCGLGRLSKRSLAAVLAFVGSGMLTVALLRHVLGVL